jgi:hypothetical protein
MERAIAPPGFHRPVSEEKSLVHVHFALLRVTKITVAAFISP